MINLLYPTFRTTMGINNKKAIKARTMAAILAIA